MDLRLTVEQAHGAALQDLGRSRTRAGLTTGGARDQHAARSASALVGSPAGAPLVEAVLGDLTAVGDRDLLVAATGAATLHLEGVAVDTWAPVVAPAGARIALRVQHGVAAYLAVAGALRAPGFAGSAAPDPGLGFGTRLAAGDALHVDGAPERLTDAVLGVGLLRPVTALQPRPADALDLLPGPDLDEGLRRAIAATGWTVDPRSDHVGVRLHGDLPARAPQAEPVSRGVPVGAVELPGAGGELIVLQRGRSLTAGYPLVAVVARVDQDRVAQLLPGETVALRWGDRERSRAAATVQAAAERSVEAAVRHALESW